MEFKDENVTFGQKLRGYITRSAKKGGKQANRPVRQLFICFVVATPTRTSDTGNNTQTFSALQNELS